MFCGTCIKFKIKKKCPKIATVTRTSLACSQCVLDTKRIPFELMETAMSLAKKPTAQIRMLMSLLDAELRLRPKCMSLGLASPYAFKSDVDNKNRHFRVHLISFPRDADDKAYGIAFSARNSAKSKRATSFYVSKKLFQAARDKKLVAIWDRLEHVSMYLDPQNKKRAIVKTIKRLGKKRAIKMLELSHVQLGSKKVALKQRNMGDIINGLCKYL